MIASTNEEAPAELQLAGDRSAHPSRRTNMTIISDQNEKNTPQFAGSTIPTGVASERFTASSREVSTGYDDSVLISTNGHATKLQTLDRDGFTIDNTIEIGQETKITASDVRLGDPFVVIYTQDEIRLSAAQARITAAALIEYAALLETL